MSYSPDMEASARRHLEAADALPDKRHDVAGYLFGIAAECGIKAMMRESGFPVPEKREGPYYQHFPELRTSLRDSVMQGRRFQVLRRFIEDDSFMQQWDVSMRYSKGSEIKPEWVERWKDQAKNVVSCIGT